MDAYRVSTIQESFLPLNYITEECRENEGPEQLPLEYHRYWTAEQFTKSMPPQAILPLGKEPLTDDVTEYWLESPNTVVGLLEVRVAGSCFWEIGVVISKKLVVTPFCIEGEWAADFYPAFHGDKYFMKVPVCSIFSNKALKFSVLILESPVGHITGTVKLSQKDLNLEQDRRDRRNDRRGDRRDDRRRRVYMREERRDRRRDERTETQEEVNQANMRLVRYGILDGKVGQKMVESSFRGVCDIAEESLISGVCLFKSGESTFTLIGVVSAHRFTAIQHKDVFDSYKEEQRRLVCQQFYFNEQECLWISNYQWKNLVSLDLQTNGINASSCRHLATANWSQLKELNLGVNPISHEGCAELVKAILPQLQKLELRCALIGNEGCRWLSLAEWPELAELNLRNNSVMNSGCAWLARANWPKLKRLNLARNRLGNQGMEELVRANWDLQVIQLSECWIQDRGCKWLSRARWPSLRQLCLEDNSFTNVGLKWLCKGNWRLLARLLLRHNTPLNMEGCNSFSHFKCPSLYELSVSMNRDSPCNLKLLKAEFPRLYKLAIHRLDESRQPKLDGFEEWSGQRFLNCKLSVELEVVRRSR